MTPLKSHRHHPLSRIALEVFAKHQDNSEDRLWEDIQAGKTPERIERKAYKAKGSDIEMTIWEQRPGGSPNRGKPDDSVQANVISRISPGRREMRSNFPPTSLRFCGSTCEAFEN